MKMALDKLRSFESCISLIHPLQDRVLSDPWTIMSKTDLVESVVNVPYS